MSGCLRIEDDGTRRVQIGDGPEFVADLYEVYNEWLAISLEHDDGRGGELAHYVAMIERLGGGKVSRKAAALFVEAIVNEVRKSLEKKALGSTPSSAGNTASIAST